MSYDSPPGAAGLGPMVLAAGALPAALACARSLRSCPTEAKPCPADSLRGWGWGVGGMSDWPAEESAAGLHHCSRSQEGRHMSDCWRAVAGSMGWWISCPQQHFADHAGCTGTAQPHSSAHSLISTNQVPAHQYMPGAGARLPCTCRAWPLTRWRSAPCSLGGRAGC